jgi:CHAT domain-containing protein/Tfp pilus assembly protein PilF
MRKTGKRLLAAVAVLMVWTSCPKECHADLLGPSDSTLARTFQEGRYAAGLPLAEALLLRANSDSEHAAGVASNNLAEVMYNLGRYAEARPLYERSLNLIEKTQGADHPDTAVVLNNLGGMQRELGEFDKARALIERALSITEAKRGPLHPETASSLNNLGLLYKQLGRSEQALELLERALSIREKSLGPRAFETGRSLNNVASVHVLLRRFEQALLLYERALAITIEVNGRDHAAVAIRLNNVASVHFYLEHYDQALRLYEQASLIVASTLGPLHISHATNLNNLGGVYEATNQQAKARVLYERALLISFAAAVPETSFNIAANLARFHDGQGNSGAAIFFAKQAINIFQGIRFNAMNMDKNVRKSLIEKNQQIYHELANWLIDLDRIVEARQVLKMLKEEEYFDFIGRDAVGDSRKTHIEFDGEEQILDAQFASLFQEAVLLGNEQRKSAQEPTSDDYLAAKARNDHARSLLTVLETRFLQASSTFTTALGRPAISERTSQAPDGVFVKARSDIAVTRQGVALVEYLVVGDRVRILLTTGKSTMVRSVDIDGREFQRKLIEFRQSLENRLDDPRPLARDLHGTLIAPIASELKRARVKILMLSLEGGLRYIPFSALFDGKRYLAEQYALTMYAAAANTKNKVRVDRRWEVIAFGTTQAQSGFSALPGVRQELASIVGQAGLAGEINLDEQFTATQMRAGLARGFPVLHLASHFKFTPGTEADSFLLLGDGNLLTLRQLREEDYRFEKLDLLTLSACETAMHGGRDANGREVEGMGDLGAEQGRYRSFGNAVVNIRCKHAQADAKILQLARG